MTPSFVHGADVCARGQRVQLDNVQWCGGQAQPERLPRAENAPTIQDTRCMRDPEGRGTSAWRNKGEREVKVVVVCVH